MFKSSWKCALNCFCFQGDRGFDGLAGLPGEKGNRVSFPPFPAGMNPWEEEVAGMRHRGGSMSLRAWGMSQLLSSIPIPGSCKIPLQNPPGISPNGNGEGKKITSIMQPKKKAKQEAKPAGGWCSWGWKLFANTMGSNSLVYN